MKFSCECTGLGHRFQQKFLFRGLDYVFEAGRIHLVKGSNGTGKSTFLKILSGAMDASEGSVLFKLDGNSLAIEDVWQHMGFVSPYQELPEELRLPELISFQTQLEGSGLKADYDLLIRLFGLEKDLGKPIRNYSTGMKQKARFVLGLGAKRSIWLLDEPGSNLDAESSDKFWKFLIENKQERLIILASNEPEEFKKADLLISLT